MLQERVTSTNAENGIRSDSVGIRRRRVQGRKSMYANIRGKKEAPGCREVRVEPAHVAEGGEGSMTCLSRGIVENAADAGREPMQNVACIASHVKRIEWALRGSAGSLSRHEDLLDLSQRWILVEPFPLCCVLVAKRAFDVGVCESKAFLKDC